MNNRYLIRFFFGFCIIFFLTTPFSGLSITHEEAFDTTLLRSHISYLASEELEGRYPGTTGDKMAAVYIMNQFEKAGLNVNEPFGLQSFYITAGVSPGEDNFFVIDGDTLDIEEHYYPVEFSANGKLSEEVIFCGYGFSINEKEFKWDDYKDIDVKGKWVLILRGNPEPDNTESKFPAHSGDREKVFLAGDRGAAGVIFVSGEKHDKTEELKMLRSHEGQVRIPVMQIKRSTADKILKEAGHTIKTLESGIIETMYPLSLNTYTSVSARVDLNVVEVETFNVIAELKTDKASEYYIVTGAHYDHLGFGGPNSNSRRPGINAVHPGADDNASGVAAIIEIARSLSENKEYLNYNHLFVAFGAEEKGLLGSKYFVDNSPVETEKMKAMFNIDMVGRMKDDNSLQIGGVGSGKEFNELLNGLNKKHGLSLTLSEVGYGPSDHASFYAVDIPVLFFSTGAHEDYHTPADTEDKINYPGLIRTLDFIYDLLLKIDHPSAKLTFSEAGPQTRSSVRHGGRGVSLGIMPDFTSDRTDGLRAEVVSPGGPAQTGGMKNGDIITAINGNPVKDIHEYMYRLSQIEPGELINVDIVRNGKEIVLIIQL